MMHHLWEGTLYLASTYHSVVLVAAQSATRQRMRSKQGAGASAQQLHSTVRTSAAASGTSASSVSRASSPLSSSRPAARDSARDCSCCCCAPCHSCSSSLIHSTHVYSTGSPAEGAQVPSTGLSAAVAVMTVMTEALWWCSDVLMMCPCYERTFTVQDVMQADMCARCGCCISASVHHTAS